MKKKALILLTLILSLAMMSMTSCGKAEFGAGDDTTEKSMNITAKNAGAGDSFTSGTLEVATGEEISVSADLEKGSVVIQFFKATEADIDASIEDITAEDAEIISEANLSGNDSMSFQVDEGEYMVKATVGEKATGTISINVVGSAADEEDSDVAIDLGTSEIYTEDDMQAAVDLINTEFAGWKGCKMQSIKYAGDECNSTENVEWLNSLEAGEGKNFTQCIEFLMNFHSPVDEKDYEGTAWNPDSDYTDYQWWLAREEGGEWVLVSTGY